MRARVLIAAMVTALVVVLLVLLYGRLGPNPPGPPGPVNVPDDRDAQAGDEPLGGDSVTRIVYLQQNWTPERSQQFYFTSQGSQILPYDWFLALESAADETAFRDDRNMLKFGYLLQKKDGWNPDALPVGFVKDDVQPRAWLGLTCAACHTSQINYKGVGYRIDGGPSLADVHGLLVALADALKATRDQPAKFERFATRILGSRDSPQARDELKEMLTATIDRRDSYNRRNFPADSVAGFGRVDAFGAILNEVFHEAARIPPGTSDPAMINTQAATAPVSYPCLWDTPQHDFVQWNGGTPNAGLGSLARNVGEVLGVFGRFEIPEQPGQIGYQSSVQIRKLLELEDWVRSLWSPLWPDGLPPIDPDLRKQGEEVYKNANCALCHEDIKRTDPKRIVHAVNMAVGTDPGMAFNFSRRHGSTGKLQGVFKQLVGPPLGSSERFGPDASGEEILAHAVIGTIVGSGYSAPEDELTKIQFQRRPRGPMLAAAPPLVLMGIYKGRPLNGIWATAPYLHNGSVPTLADLLKPAKDRPKTFTVGSREFDPVTVGFRTDAPGYPIIRARNEDGTPVPGNSNEGHEFGANLSEGDRRALLEYLKSL